MNDGPDSRLLLIAFIILSEKGNYSNENCVFDFRAKLGGYTLYVYFVTTIVHLIHKQGRYNILELIQCLVQHFQDMATSKGVYIACYGRLGVAVLSYFNHRTTQVYIYTHAL